MEKLISILNKYGNYICSKNISPEHNGGYFKFHKINKDIYFSPAEGYLIPKLANKNNGGRLRDIIPSQRLNEIEPHYESTLNGNTVVYSSENQAQGFEMLFYLEPVFENGTVIEGNAYAIDISKWDTKQRMINILTLDGILTYVSDRWVEISGFEREEVINQSVFPLIEPNSLEEIKQTVINVLETKRSQHIYYKGYRKDKSIIDLFAMALPVVYQDDVKFFIVIHT